MPMHRASISAAACVAVQALTACGALAQEAMYTNAATMPSKGVTVVRPQFNYYRFGANPGDGSTITDVYEVVTSVQYGIARGWSLTLDVPVQWRNQEFTGPPAREDSDYGVDDLDFTFKYRMFKHDTGGVDTLRAALLGGARVASGDDHDFSSQSVNPHFGAVVTMVLGRHGFNQEVDWTFNTGGSDDDNFGGGDGASDALRYNSAYLFRVWPERYTSTTTGSWYVTEELNGLYETNGDNEVRFSPGFMYEGYDFAVEVMMQFPLIDELDHRPELDFSVGFGVRAKAHGRHCALIRPTTSYITGTPSISFGAFVFLGSADSRFTLIA